MRSLISGWWPGVAFFVVACLAAGHDSSNALAAERPVVRDSLASSVLSYARASIATEHGVFATPSADFTLSAQDSETAEQLVARALAAEAAGDTQARLSLLRQALLVDPAYAPAHWHLGELSIDGVWKSIRCVSMDSAYEGKMSDYRQLRDVAGFDADVHYQLARWCQVNGLGDQERTHILYALQLKRTHLGANKRLQQLQLQNKQTIAYQQKKAKQEALDSLKMVREWQPRIVRLRKEAESDDRSRRELALAELASIKDLATLPVIESVLGNANTEIGNAVVTWLAGFDDQRATDSMIRCAISAKDPTVRRSAAEVLKQRSWFSYVPTMMSVLVPPTQVEFEPTNLPGAFQLSFTEIGPDAEYKVRLDPRRDVLYPLNAAVTPAARQQTDAALQLVKGVEAANVARQVQNEKIAQALRVTTGQKLDDLPESWWDWWINYNEIYRAPEKRIVNYILSNDGRSLVECFAAGTPVWAITGPVPIERVQMGESVLAQNPLTGELAYKVVLATTERPPSPLIVIRAGGETIHATRGHPFWVSGLGWQMAKELKAGQRLHTTSGPVAIESIGEQGSGAAYNLLVDGFHTYFVTDRHFLVHDNLIREVTPATVPGMTIATATASKDKAAR